MSPWLEASLLIMRGFKHKSACFSLQVTFLGLFNIGDCVTVERLLEYFPKFPFLKKKKKNRDRALLIRKLGS